MKKWYKRPGLIVGGLLLLALIAVIVDWQITVNRSRRELEKVRAALDVSEPGWQLDQLNERRNAALPPDDQNIALIALKVYEAFPESFSRWEYDPKTFDWRSNGKVNHLADPDDVSKAREQFKPVLPLVAKLHEIRKYSKGGKRLRFGDPDPMNQVNLAHVQDLRNTAGRLNWSALIAANENDPDQAIEDIRTCLHLRLAIGDEPTVISQLVRMAVVAVAVRAAERVIGLTEPKRGLAELQAELETALTEKFVLAGFEGDRAATDRLMQNWVNGSYDPTDGMGAGVLDFLEGFASSRFLRANHATKLDLLTAARDAMKQTGMERKRSMASLPAIATKNPSAVLARLLLPSTEKVMQAELRTETNLATMAVAIACERYRQQTGRWPQSLGDIPKTILKAVPDDPYVGGPVKYKRTETGIVFYATGTDGADDGGAKLDLAGTKPGSDVGVELFDPAHRRKPPVPKEDGEMPGAPPGP